MLEDWIILKHSEIPVTELGEWSQAIPPAASSLDISYCDNKIYGDVDLASAAKGIFKATECCVFCWESCLCGDQNPVASIAFFKPGRLKFSLFPNQTQEMSKETLSNFNSKRKSA